MERRRYWSKSWTVSTGGKAGVAVISRVTMPVPRDTKASGAESEREDTQEKERSRAHVQRCGMSPARTAWPDPERDGSQFAMRRFAESGASDELKKLAMIKPACRALGKTGISHKSHSGEYLRHSCSSKLTRSCESTQNHPPQPHALQLQHLPPNIRLHQKRSAICVEIKEFY
mmetsp:Transcript_14805/g.37774  ORF Transcript_14805/g.37774 Transcript_14805/m.37774 type:complete len:173 (-) Transcript_14805:6-524(-)